MPVDATGTAGVEADAAGHHQFNRVMVAIYATITLLGVIAAASWKETAEDEVELIAIILGASAAVSLAHLWAAIMAEQLVHGRFPDRRPPCKRLAPLWPETRRRPCGQPPPRGVAESGAPRVP